MTSKIGSGSGANPADNGDSGSPSMVKKVVYNTAAMVAGGIIGAGVGGGAGVGVCAGVGMAVTMGHLMPFVITGAVIGIILAITIIGAIHLYKKHQMNKLKDLVATDEGKRAEQANFTMAIKVANDAVKLNKPLSEENRTLVQKYLDRFEVYPLCFNGNSGEKEKKTLENALAVAEPESI